MLMLVRFCINSSSGNPCPNTPIESCGWLKGDACARVCPSVFVISYLNSSGMENVYDGSVFSTKWTCNIFMSMNYLHCINK